MKKILLLLCLSWAVSLHAQQFKVDFSSAGHLEDDVATFHRYGKILCSNKTNWGKMQFAFSANLKKVKYGIELTQYDEQLKELKKLSLDKDEKDFGPFSPTVHYGESAIYVMYFKFVDDDKIKMYVTKVNPTDLSVIATKEIMQYDQKNLAIWGTMKTIDNSQSFYTVSEDGKNAWVIHASPTHIISTVIDGDLNIVQKTEQVPVKLDKLAITGAYIGNDGNKALAYRYDNPEFSEFYTRGIFFQPANAKGSFQTIKFPNGYAPGNLELQGSKDGKKLYLAGDYFGDDYTFGSKGVFLGEINIAAQSIAAPKFYPYTDEIKQRVLDLDFASKKKGEIIFTDHHLNYRIDEMQNGTIVLSSDMATSASTSKITFYYVGPIIHVFIKPGGNTSMNLIPKKQASSTYTSFFNYIFNDKLICIYGDLPKFQEKEFEDKQIGLVRTTGDIVPVANVYDAEGKMISKKMLLDNAKGMKGNVMISNRSKIGDNKFLFPVGESKVNMVRYYTKVNQMCYLDIL